MVYNLEISSLGAVSAYIASMVAAYFFKTKNRLSFKVGPECTNEDVGTKVPKLNKVSYAARQGSLLWEYLLFSNYAGIMYQGQSDNRASVLYSPIYPAFHAIQFMSLGLTYSITCKKLM